MADQSVKEFNNDTPNVSGVKLPEPVNPQEYELPREIATPSEGREIAQMGKATGMLVDGILNTAVRASQMAATGEMDADDSKHVYETAVKIAENLGASPDEIAERMKKIDPSLSNQPKAAELPPIKGVIPYNNG